MRKGIPRRFVDMRLSIYPGTINTLSNRASPHHRQRHSIDNTHNGATRLPADFHKSPA